MKIRSRVRYAIRMMIDIMEHSKPGVPVRIKDVADRQGISKNYLQQLVIPMKTASLLRSVSGKNGGYALSKPAENIRVGDIFEALNGPVFLLECIESEDLCMASEYCKCRRMWVEVNAKIKETLNAYTLIDLLDDKKRKSFESGVLLPEDRQPDLCATTSRFD